MQSPQVTDGDDCISKYLHVMLRFSAFTDGSTLQLSWQDNLHIIVRYSWAYLGRMKQP